MAWTETKATAWGEVELKIGTPSPTNEMSTSLLPIGYIKEDSLAIETADGSKLEWKAVGGKVVDSLTTDGSITIKCNIKNINKSNLEKFWNIEEDATNGKLKVFGMSTSKKYSVQISPKVENAEVFEAPYCSVSMKATFSEKEGWGQEVSFTLLSGGENKPLFMIGQVPVGA